MTDIPIPPEALEAAAIELAPHPWSMYTDAAQDHFRKKATAAIRAMLANWPGMEQVNRVDGSQGIILPLQQEPHE